MSVDERLRAGLERNASVVVPAGEARLVAVRRRHRRRITAMTVGGVGAAAATVVLGFTLVGGGAGRSAPEPLPPADSSAPLPTVTQDPGTGPIPDSTWRKVVTLEQAQDLGVPSARIVRDIGDDGRLPLELRLEGGRFTLTGDFGGAVAQTGDIGKVTYDEAGRLVVESLTCAACSDVTLTWRIEDSRLEITRMGARGGPMTRAVWLGTWQRAD